MLLVQICLSNSDELLKIIFNSSDSPKTAILNMERRVNYMKFIFIIFSDSTTQQFLSKLTKYQTGIETNLRLSLLLDGILKCSGKASTNCIF